MSLKIYLELSGLFFVVEPESRFDCPRAKRFGRGNVASVMAWQAGLQVSGASDVDVLWGRLTS